MMVFREMNLQFSREAESGCADGLCKPVTALGVCICI